MVEQHASQATCNRHALAHSWRITQGSGHNLPLHSLPAGPAGELRSQPLSNALNSLPPALLAAGADVPFVAGAPNTLWAPEVPGFRRVIGETIGLSGAYPCEGSLR